MRWVLLGRFGETARQYAAFVLGRHDAVAAILEPKARLRPSWDEARFRAVVRDWADRHFPELRPVLGLQYPLGRGLFETEWLLYCPLCGAGPFHVPCQAGEAGLEPRAWDDRRILHLLAERFHHVHPQPGPEPDGGQAGDRAGGEGAPVPQDEPAPAQQPSPGEGPFSGLEPARHGLPGAWPEAEAQPEPAARRPRRRRLPAIPPTMGVRPA